MRQAPLFSTEHQARQRAQDAVLNREACPCHLQKYKMPRGLTNPTSRVFEICRFGIRDSSHSSDCKTNIQTYNIKNKHMPVLIINK